MSGDLPQRRHLRNSTVTESGVLCYVRKLLMGLDGRDQPSCSCSEDVTDPRVRCADVLHPRVCCLRHRLPRLQRP